jgi:hypothetical protein
MNCCQWAKEEVGTAPFPIAKEHLKLKVWVYNQKEECESE